MGEQEEKNDSKFVIFLVKCDVMQLHDLFYNFKHREIKKVEMMR